MRSMGNSGKEESEVIKVARNRSALLLGLVALVLVTFVGLLLTRSAGHPLSAASFATDFQVTYETRYWGGETLGDVHSAVVYSVYDGRHFRGEETVSGSVSSGEAYKTISVQNGNTTLISKEDQTGNVTEQQRAVWNVPMPKEIDAYMARTANLPASHSPLGDLASISLPVVDRDLVQGLIGSGDVSMQGTDNLLGETTDIIDIPASLVVGQPMRVWLTSDGIKLKMQILHDTDVINQWEASSLTRSVHPQGILDLPINPDRLSRDFGSRLFDPTAIIPNYSGPGSMSADAIAQVVSPTTLAGLPTYTIQAPVFITTTMAMDTPDASDDTLAGWFVTHEILGPSGKRVLVIQAPDGVSLPVAMPEFWPDDLASDAPGGGIGTGGLYAEKEEVIVGNAHFGDVYRPSTAAESTQGFNPLPFDRMLTTVVNRVIRCVFVGYGMTREELIAVAGAFIPDHPN